MASAVREATDAKTGDLARDSGALALPEDGPVAVLHARPRPFLREIDAFFS